MSLIATLFSSALCPLSHQTFQQDSVSIDADVLAAVNEVFYPDGQVVSLEAVFGNSVTYDADGGVSGAKAMLQVI